MPEACLPTSQGDVLDLAAVMTRAINPETAFDTATTVLQNLPNEWHGSPAIDYRNADQAILEPVYDRDEASFPSFTLL